MLKNETLEEIRKSVKTTNITLDEVNEIATETTLETINTVSDKTNFIILKTLPAKKEEIEEKLDITKFYLARRRFAKRLEKLEIAGLINTKREDKVIEITELGFCLIELIKYIARETGNRTNEVMKVGMEKIT